MASTPAVWHGTTGPNSEYATLQDVLARYCRGNDFPDQGCGELCESHKMLQDQRVMDGLLMSRRIAELLEAEELCDDPKKLAAIRAKYIGHRRPGKSAA